MSARLPWRAGIRPPGRTWDGVVRRSWGALVVSGIAMACTTAAPERGGSSRDHTAPVREERAVVPTHEPVAAPRPTTELVVEPLPTDREAPEATVMPSATAARLDAAAAELRALLPDPAPAQTTNDLHYLVSNERRLDLFRPELDDRGGVMLGVGTDQNYVMAAWSRTELLVIVDFDQQVVDLHAVHGALLAVAPTAEDFRRLWAEDGADAARAAVRAAHPERPELVELYDTARKVVDRRLRNLARRYAELGVRSWLDTPAQYRYVADLHARGRVVALRGDFTRDGLLRRVAAVLHAHALPLKVLYLSNIEQYFTYRRPFKDNMLALPLHDDTLVLRTLPGRPAGFHYIVQRGADLHAWMRAPKVWSVYRIRGMAKGEHLVAGERFVAGAPPATG
jgi:hypothetical protein